MNQKNGAKADGVSDAESVKDESSVTAASDVKDGSGVKGGSGVTDGVADATQAAVPPSTAPAHDGARGQDRDHDTREDDGARRSDGDTEAPGTDSSGTPPQSEGPVRPDDEPAPSDASAPSRPSAPPEPDASPSEAPAATRTRDKPEDPGTPRTPTTPTASATPAAPTASTAPAAPAAPRESESERTSEFVALKPDLPRPVAPRPVAPAPTPSRAAKTHGEGPDGSERTREFGAPPVQGDDRTMALTAPPGATPPPSTPATGGPAGAPPPLDLLAQLTNTPPKPETPVRTVARRIKIWGTLAVLLAIVVVTVQALRPLPAPTLELTVPASHTASGGALSLPWPTEGQAVVDIDGLGRMGTYGEMKPLPIGSVAKVMTTYLILRDHPLKPGDKGPMIPVDQKAQDDYTTGVPQRESVVEVKAGQQISEREALQAVMLPSANNVARLLARWDASTEETFIKKMNDTAKEFGMTNTTYTDASGLKESTVSTADDQVKLAKRAMAVPTFREITRLPSYTSTTTSGGSTVETARTQRNFNSLVPLYGVVGIKTGSTTKAGGNLLFAAEKTVGDSKQLIIGAVFGQHKPNIIETATAASKNLILAAGNALRNETVVKKGEVVGRVDDGLGGTVPVVAAKDLAVPVWSGAAVGIKLTDDGKKLPHSAKAGTVVGTLTVGGGTGEVKVPVTLRDALSEPSFGSKITRLG
ncbi:D-alanyl-D-alanine carboxypeptidase [Streptomyces sp. NPDC006704]|uniref:D-alanyl-D-alanine carboxypeptidase n=1 Tax=Streptomyces sp. NPDC006704 TaxID=3364760 RepID=UPI0036C8F3B1